MRALVACGLFVFVMGCGPSVDTGAGGGPVEAPSPWLGAGGAGGAGVTCVTHDGVRMCGGTDAQCPSLPPPECPGYGCTDTYRLEDGTAASAGVCWADFPNVVSDGCSTCPDGMVCAEREPGWLVCVPETVCAALWELGERDVCTYADKARYDHRALPEPAGCPKTGSGLCGGGCGDCRYGRCTGRSPRHPYGFCTGAFLSEIRRCVVGGTGDDGCLSDNACAVFQVPAEDETTARRYGVCLSRDYCGIVASALPGGLHCYDQAGVDVAR